MQKFDVLKRELNVFDTHFLEASAGTGKTFAIEHLVVRLLIDGSCPATIDQILVVTFTRAATRELKLRIRHNLTQVVHALRTRSGEADYVQALIEEGEEKVQQAICRIEDALTCFDQAQIFTVHGFCHQVLSELAFEAGIGFNPVEPEERGHIGLIDQMVEDFLRTQFRLPGYSPVQINSVLKNYSRNIDRLRKAMTAILSGNKQISTYPSFIQTVKKWEEHLLMLPPIDLQKWEEDFAAQRICYYDMKKSLYDEQANYLGTLLQKKSCSFAEFDQLLKEEKYFLELMAPDNVMRTAKQIDSSTLHYPHLIEQLQNMLLPLRNSARSSSHIFLRMVRDCQFKTQIAMGQSEKFSPDAILDKMHACLKAPLFLEKARRKYRAAIIDEFQDTDPVQWDIFRQLFLGKIDAVCLVGDPKQSIYSFRNADVYTYLAAATAMGEESRKYLDTNFRSRSSLVEALNVLFCSAEGKGWIRLPAKGIILQVPAVKAHHKSDLLVSGPEQRGSVHFFLSTDSVLRKGLKWPTKKIQQTCFFPFIAEEILRMRKDQDLAWDHFAILVKDRYQARDLLEFLKKQQIPACLKRGGALNESTAYFAMRELLEAACYPSDLGKLKKLMANPLVGWTAEMVQGGLEKECLQIAKAQLLQWHDILYEKGFACFFQEFMNEMHVSQTLLAQGDVSVYSDLRQLAEILIEHEFSKKVSKEGLLTYLEELEETDLEEEVRLKIRPQEEKGSVALMTVHMSKGLEFGTVFALGLASRHACRDEIALKREGKDEISAMDLKDPACRQALDEADAEKLRQLYVALTRAKRRVYVPLAINCGKVESLEPGQASPSELFFAHLTCPEGIPNVFQNLVDGDDCKDGDAGAASNEVLKHVRYSYEQIRSFSLETITGVLKQLSQKASISYSVAEPRDLAAEHPDLPVPIQLIHPPIFQRPGPIEFLRSFSSIAKKSHEFSALAAPEPSLFPTVHTLPAGAETGLVFHRMMEKIFNAQLHRPLQLSQIKSLVFSETDQGPLQAWQDVLYGAICAILQQPLLMGARAFSLCDVPVKQMQQEMEFAYRTSDGIMKGFADLCFEYQDRYYLLDWKTNYLGPADSDYSKEQLVLSMEKNDYYLQASVYAEALRRYVKLFDNRPFETCFGGAFYFFIRGRAIHHFIPKRMQEA